MQRATLIRRIGLIGWLLAAVVAAPAFAVPPPVEAYGKLPAVEDVSLSPDGKSFAFIAVVGESRRLVVSSIDNKLIYQSGVGTAKVRAVDWAGDDHLLVTVSSTVNLGPDFTVMRHEFFSVVAINVRTGKTVAIFDKHHEVANAVFGYYGTTHRDGHAYGFFGAISYERDPEGSYHLGSTYPDLYQVDLDTGALTRVAEGSELIDGWLVGPDGTVLARTTYNQQDGDWRVQSGARGGVLLDSGRSLSGGVEFIGLGRTPDQLLIRRPTDHGVLDEVVPLAGGAAVEVADDEAIDDVLVARKTGLWIGYTTFGDVPEHKMFDPVTEARFRGTRKAFPDQSVRFDSWSDDFSKIIVFTSGGDDSGTYWIVDIPTGSADPIGYEYPKVLPESVGPIKMVDWKATDGMDLHGVLSLPPGRMAKNLPLIVMPHGGPEARDYPTFDWWAQAFAARGYAVFQPNFRGSTGYSEKYLEAGFGEYGRKMQTDITDGVAALASQGIIDPKRACIVGASYGGYSAMVGVTLMHGHYRCSVSVAGLSNVSDFVGYVSDEAGHASADRRMLSTMTGKDLSQISPIKFADKADAPILLIYGKDDTQVPVDQTLKMQRALQSAGKPVELVVLPDEDHFMSHEATRVLMLKTSMDFVEKYNPPDPEAAAPPRADAK